MLSPSNPGVDGTEKVIHDGMDDAGHKTQFGHANSGSTYSADKAEKKDSNKDQKVDKKEYKEEEEE